MTYEIARDQIVSMIENITDLDPRGFAPSFTHVKTESLNDEYAQRSFTLHLESGATSSASVGANSRWSYNELTLNVYYDDVVERDEQDAVIHADYLKIRDTFFDTANWNRPASTIVSLSNNGTAIYPFVITEPSDEGRTLSITIPLTHTEQTS